MSHDIALQALHQRDTVHPQALMYISKQAGMCSSIDLWTGVTFVVAVEEFKRAQRFANFKTNELNTVEGQGGQVSGCFVQFVLAHPWLDVIYPWLVLIYQSL